MQLIELYLTDLAEAIDALICVSAGTENTLTAGTAAAPNNGCK